jgi:CheY-like chemotaxis protein
MSRKSKILWLDDHLGRDKHIVGAFSKFGIALELVTSVAEAISIAQKKKFDLYLVDLKMPMRDGTEFIDYLLKNKTKKSKICAISSFLYTSRYRNFLEDRSEDLYTLEKDIPLYGSDEFGEEFIKALEDILHSEGSSSEKYRFEEGYEGEVLAPNTSPFRVRFKEFSEMNELAQGDLVQRAYRIGRSTAKKEFASGAKWVLLCGDSKSVFQSSMTMQNAPTQDDLIAIASEEDRVPILFVADDPTPEIEDDASEACLGADWIQRYPVLRVVIEGHSESSDKFVHFDTGARRTYYSYEELKDIGRHKRIKVLIPQKRGEVPYLFYDDDLEFRFVNPDGLSEKIVTLKVRVVMDWLDAPFSAACTPTCASPGREMMKSGLFNCLSRPGLIGRDILEQVNVELTTDVTQSASRRQAKVA